MKRIEAWLHIRKSDQQPRTCILYAFLSLQFHAPDQQCQIALQRYSQEQVSHQVRYLGLVDYWRFIEPLARILAYRPLEYCLGKSKFAGTTQTLHCKRGLEQIFGGFRRHSDLSRKVSFVEQAC